LLADRLRRASHLPPAKTLEALDEERIPRSVLVKARDLARGEFVESAENAALRQVRSWQERHSP